MPVCRCRHTVLMSTTANAPSPSALTTILLISRRLWTRVWVSNRSCHPRRQRSASKRPHTMTHVIGSCDCAVGGHGHTMAGWKQETSRSASWVSHARVSRSTISRICGSAWVKRMPDGGGLLSPERLLVPRPLRHLLVHGVERVGGGGEKPAARVVPGAALDLQHGDGLARQAPEEIGEHPGREEARRRFAAAWI